MYVCFKEMDNVHQILISIIIPVYQAEKTIVRCLKSIVSNNAEIEIICVDDGSEDNSLIILNELAKNDSRIKVIHQDNAGAAAARNKGLDFAKGKYIMFCDSDDSYLPNTIDSIVDDICTYKTDYIVFRLKTVKMDGEVVYYGSGNGTDVLNVKWYEYVNNFILQHNHGLGVVTKVFRKSIIDLHNIRFGDFLFSEDLWFILTYLKYAKIFVADNRAFYQQFRTQNSICQKSYKNYYELNTQCIHLFMCDYPYEAKLIAPFLLKLKINIINYALTRIMFGQDASSFKEKRSLCSILFSLESVRSAILKILKTNPNLSKWDRNNYNDILKKNFYSYYFRNYYLSSIKSFIKRALLFYKYL